MEGNRGAGQYSWRLDLPVLKMRRSNYSLADLCGSILTLLSSQVKKMEGGESSGAVLSRKTGTFPGKLFKRSETIQHPRPFFEV
jgi:hypothetical protein